MIAGVGASLVRLIAAHRRSLTSRREIVSAVTSGTAGMTGVVKRPLFRPGRPSQLRLWTRRRPANGKADVGIGKDGPAIGQRSWTVSKEAGARNRGRLQRRLRRRRNPGATSIGAIVGIGPTRRSLSRITSPVGAARRRGNRRQLRRRPLRNRTNVRSADAARTDSGRAMLRRRLARLRRQTLLRRTKTRIGAADRAGQRAVAVSRAGAFGSSGSERAAPGVA